MATVCFGTLQAKAVRVTELDECGAPLIGGNFVVSEGFVTITLSAELESGTEFIQKNASGQLCINQRDPDALKRLNVTINWCKVDPDILNLITGFPVETETSSPGSDTVGFRIEEGVLDAKWGLEFWTGIAGSRCDSSGNPLYGYGLVPFITGSSIGDISWGDTTTTFDTTGYTQGYSGWDVGPYDVTGTPAGPLPVAVGDLTHAILRVVNVAPPTAQCGAQTLTSS